MTSFIRQQNSSYLLKIDNVCITRVFHCRSKVSECNLPSKRLFEKIDLYVSRHIFDILYFKFPTIRYLHYSCFKQNAVYFLS